jgi:uncharacterized protein YggT (Ycf19 family)
MALFDFLIGLMGLLLWLNWLALGSDPLSQSRTVSLLGTLKKAGPRGPHRWLYLVGLVALLLGRALLYWLASHAITWTPRLDFGLVALSFRSDDLAHTLVFSFLGFGALLAGFYLWLLLLSVVNRSLPAEEPIQRLVRLHFGWLERWPLTLKLILPFLFGALCWLALHPLLTALAVVAPPRSNQQLLEQGALIGLETYLSWKYLILAVLLGHIVNSYIYLGKHPIWNYVDATARHLLVPLRWLPLRIGKLDLLPVVAAVLVFCLAEFLTNPARWLSRLVLPF